MSDSLNTYTVIMLGPRGSGKTVYLASMYKKLSTQGKQGFFLEIDSAEKRKRLHNIYTQIAIEEKWPQQTQTEEVSEWNFTCRVQTENLPIYSACRFKYLDYAGGRLTDEMEEDGDTSFESKLQNADALLGLLDGQKLRALMRNEKLGKCWVIKEMPNMLNIMQGSQKPIHFVISKWDILINEYSLEQLRDRLLEIEEFRNLIQLRHQARLPVRLIPISSVGMGFAELQPDGSMAKTGSLPNPFLVEMPLACILPDMIKTTLEEIIKKKQAESKPIEVKPNLSFWERLGQVVGGVGKIVVGTVTQMLPKKYRFAEDILEDLIDFLDDLEKPAQQKREAAAKRKEELRRKQAESLKKVTDEETALKHVVNCFMSLTDELESKFPASNLKQL